MRRITTDELWTMLRYAGNEFFSVEFERRTNRPDGTANAGTIRKMVCRTGMHRFKLGVIGDAARDAEDFRNGVLTVWDIQAYLRSLKTGASKNIAGFNAWRRIDIVTVLRCSVLDKFDLAGMGIDDSLIPPHFNAAAHNLTNQFRLANMPQLI